MANIPTMTDHLPALVKRLRKDRDWTQSHLARQAGVKPQNIQQLENGDVKNPRYLPALAEALNVSVAYLLTGKEDTPSSAPAKRKKRNALDRANFSLVDDYDPGPRDLPVLGQAMGGPEGEFILNGEPVDHVNRPDTLNGVPGAYATRMAGTSMEPRYIDGETLYIHPGRPITVNSFVVFQIASEGNSLPHAYVKQYIGRDSDTVRFRQFNPEKDLEFPADHVVSIHRIILAGDY